MATRHTYRLQCSCCGSNALGRQWWNRDTGYGLCAKCVYWLLDRKTDPVEIELNYGRAGHHFAAPLSLTCIPGSLVSWREMSGEVDCGVLKEWDNGTAIVANEDGTKAVRAA